MSADEEKTGVRPAISGARAAPEDSPTEIKDSLEEAHGATEIRGSPVEEDGATDFRPSAAPAAGMTPAGAGTTGGMLSTYQSFGNRFEILELLGEGGMGRVYKAWDRELEKVVALKTIRGEQAKNPELLKRFKQELLLARQITHKNVIRIHDMGESEGVKFFTMEFIVGESLKDRVRKKGKIPAAETLSIAKQILGALDEAHSQGVIHRDLKPQNIMIDPEGIAHVMDFGIARSVQDTGMTATGMVMGTPDYMSPEQARGEKADARSDVFSFGVILYEMLTGELPYAGDTMASKVMARLTQRPRPVRELAPETPAFLENIVAKCLELDLGLRYRSAREILEDIERQQVDRSRSLRIRKAVARRKTGLAAALVTVSALAVAAYFAVRGRGASDAGPSAPAVTLAIVPFGNATTDPSLNWLGASVAEILTTEVGQSDRLRTIPSDRVSQILADLRIEPGSRIDSSMLARVAEFSSADTVVSGQYLKLGDRIRIDATVQDLRSDRIVPLKAEAANEDALLDAIRSLAEEMRSHLGLSRDVVEELAASTFRPSSDSLAALRNYNEGLQLARQGNHLEAVKRFQAAAEEDPGFALAHAHLGQAFARLGYDYEAEEHLRSAVELSGDLPQRERYLITAIEARIRKDFDKALESYENLAKAWPDDPDVPFRLAELYEERNEFDRARQLYDRVLQRDPAHLAALLARGNLEVKSGHPQRAFEPLNRALSLTIQLGNQEARGNALFALGLAYRDLAKTDEALRHYRDALAIRTEIGDKRGMAEALKEIAKLDWAAGRPGDAQSAYEQALELQRDIGDREGAARVLLTLGEIHTRQGHHERALDLYKDSLRTLRELADRRLESVCLNSVGSLYLDQGDYGEAQTYLELALGIRESLGLKGEMSETVHNLGELALRSGRYDAALDYYLRALELSREVGDELGVAIESYSLGKVFGYQGRPGAALKAMRDAAESVDKAQEKGFWRAAILGGLGNALNAAGRFDEGSKALEEALALSRQLALPMLISQTLGFVAEGHFYRGEPAAARRPLEEAIRAAEEEKDPRLLLSSRLGVARLEIRAAADVEPWIERIKKLAREADALGLQYDSALASLEIAGALARVERYEEARAVLEEVLRLAARAGLRIPLAQARYLLGEVAVRSGDESESRRHYREAARILDEIRSESGSDRILERADLQPISTAAASGSPSSEGEPSPERGQAAA